MVLASEKGSAMSLSRRHLLTRALSGSASLAMPAIARSQMASVHVVVVGGGFGGGTVARHLRQHLPQLRITLIEPTRRFYTCPFSNLYLAGLRSWESLGHGFDGLRASGIEVIHASAQDVNTTQRNITLDNGLRLSWDKLVLSPGVDMRWNALEGYDQAAAEQAPHAWKAGAQTQLLRQQMEAMKDGGLFVMVIPDNPFRCPPGPYERASMVAHYFKHHKPRSKILLLDAKENFSKKALFLEGWKTLYGDMIEWVSLSRDGQVVRVDAAALEVETMFGQRHKADVLNVIPPQKAGLIAERAGVTDFSGWAPVRGESFESAQVPNVYVLGDASFAGPMPKSGFAANNQGKMVAAAIAAALTDQAPPTAVYANTCYSLVGQDYGISVAGVYRAQQGRLVDMPGSVGISALNASASIRTAEARYGSAWYQAISTDIWDR